MPIVKSGALPSDEINILFDGDGSETKQIFSWSQRYKHLFPFRIIFAINQHYPELRSEAYRNRRLIALIQESLADLGLSVVIEDHFRPDGIVPEELAGSLEAGDDYLLVSETMQVRGHLNVWESLGGKSRFYHDRYILEIITFEKEREELARTVLQKCRLKSIACNHVIEK
jgi:hypothetical protein